MVMVCLQVIDQGSIAASVYLEATSNASLRLHPMSLRPEANRECRYPERVEPPWLSG